MEGTLKTTKQFARVGKSWPSTGFMKTHFLKKILERINRNHSARIEK